MGPATVPQRLATKEASTLVRQRRSAVGVVDKQNDKQRVTGSMWRCPMPRRGPRPSVSCVSKRVLSCARLRPARTSHDPIARSCYWWMGRTHDAQPGCTIGSTRDGRPDPPTGHPLPAASIGRAGSSGGLQPALTPAAGGARSTCDSLAGIGPPPRGQTGRRVVGVLLLPDWSGAGRSAAITKGHDCRR